MKTVSRGPVVLDQLTANLTKYASLRNNQFEVL
jgi:hypothetical protein